MISNSSLNHLFGANTWSHRKKSDRYILNVKNETSPIYKDFQDWKINRKDIIFPVSCFFPCYHPVSCIDISNFRVEKIRTIYFPLKFSPVNQHFESFHIFPIPCPCSNETFVIWCEIKTVFYVSSCNLSCCECNSESWFGYFCYSQKVVKKLLAWQRRSPFVWTLRFKLLLMMYVVYYLLSRWINGFNGERLIF